MAKIKDEQLQKIKELRSQFGYTIQQLGELQLAKRDIEIEEQNLLNFYSEIQKNQNSLLDEIQKEFGDGDLDLNTGEFTLKPKQ